MIDYGKELQKAFDDGYKARDAEIVRCKDCKNLGENDGYYFCNAIGVAFGEKPDWFCKDGERRDNA